MHWQVGLLATGQPAAWLAKEYLPEVRKTQAPPDANGSDTRPASGSGSRQWEQNFQIVFDQPMKVVHRYPGLSKDIDVVLGDMDKTELWN